MRSRLGAVGLAAILMLLTFLLGSFAAALLAIQPEWRSRQETASVLVAITVVGGLLVALTVAAVRSAPWGKGIRMASLAAYGAMVASYSLVYTVLAMPDWFTTIGRAPGATSTHRELTDVGEALGIAAWLSAVAAAAVLAVLLLTAAVTCHPTAKSASRKTV